MNLHFVVTKIPFGLRNFGKILFFLGSVALLSSCLKEPNFALVPAITYKDHVKQVKLDQFIGATKDSVVLNIGFQDGDGDLGLSEEEKEAAQKNNDFNYIIKQFRKTRGQFTEVEPLEPISGFFPQLKVDEKPGPIEGILSYTIQFFHSFTPRNDTLKFSIQIKDRAGNRSNTVETGEIVLNQING